MQQSHPQAALRLVFCTPPKKRLGPCDVDESLRSTAGSHRSSGAPLLSWWIIAELSCLVGGLFYERSGLLFFIYFFLLLPCPLSLFSNYDQEEEEGKKNNKEEVDHKGKMKNMMTNEIMKRSQRRRLGRGKQRSRRQ